MESISIGQGHDVTSEGTKRFKDRYPHMDVDAAVADFKAWCGKEGIKSQNANALFLTFAKTWVSRSCPS